jgi:hypothetical protein
MEANLEALVGGMISSTCYLNVSGMILGLDAETTSAYYEEQYASSTPHVMTKT